MNREEALDSVKTNVEDKDMVKHMLATEAIMRALARHFGEDEREWGLTGLLHDIDMELIEGDMSSHSKLGADLVREMGASEAMAHAVLCHNRRHRVPLETKLDKALVCTDALSELIAATLARPGKKLAGLEAKSVKERFEEEGFAPDVDRKRIALCREIGLEPDEFMALGLGAMHGIARALGL